MIATLATRADEAGVKTCVVSTDRDAFQLVSENVCLMMTPRGVADVQVYTPERVEARYGIRPDQIPDFIGLKGDTSDNIPGDPGHRRQDRGTADRAVRLARGGRRARRRALAGAVEGDRRERRAGARPRSCSRRCGATSTSASTRRRSSCSRPTARELKEIFRRFEFRALLGRVDTLDEALPAAERPAARSRRRCRGARASSGVLRARRRRGRRRPRRGRHRGGAR